MTTPETLTGHDAIAYAEIADLPLNKFADPTEDAREGLTIGEAREVAVEDPGLIWIARPTRARVQTLNQPSSRFAFAIDLTPAKLSEVLGWDPEGEWVASVLADLRTGRSRTVRTTKVPMDPGTESVEFHFEPKP